MAPPVRAALGSVTINAVAVLKVQDYNIKMAYNTTTVGPWVGDNTETDILGGSKTSLDFTVDVPEGGDAGQNAVLTATAAGTHPPLVFTATLGKSFTFPSPVYTGYDLKGIAKGGQSFKFNVTGDCTIAQV